MRSKVLAEGEGSRSWIVIFDTGDEAMAGLQAFAHKHSITAAHFSAIGAFSRAVLGYFDWQTRNYNRIPVDDQVEVVNLTGDIALQEETPKVHAHAALARRGGAMVGGHLLEAHVRPTLEVVLTETPKPLERRWDETSGIALIRL